MELITSFSSHHPGTIAQARHAGERIFDELSSMTNKEWGAEELALFRKHGSLLPMATCCCQQEGLAKMDTSTNSLYNLDKLLALLRRVLVVIPLREFKDTVDLQKLGTTGARARRAAAQPGGPIPWADWIPLVEHYIYPMLAGFAAL